MSELIIRPSHNDHLVVADLLAPGGNSLLAAHTRPPMSRLVLDAPLAVREPAYRQAAEDAGVPVVIDPLTPLLQTEVAPDNPWSRLSFATAGVVTAADLGNPFGLQKLVAGCVDLQVELGASTIVPPYLYASGPGDPAFEVSLQLIGATARYARANHINLPLTIVFCGQRKAFASESTWHAGIDRFARAALEVGPQSVALCLSPLGTGHESLSVVLSSFLVAQRLKTTGARVIAWRQGFFGPALVAAGLDGYECGIGMNESTDISGFRANRKPKPPKPDRSSKGAAVAGVFMGDLGRSIQRSTARLLLAQDSPHRGRLVCIDPRCCPKGAVSMLEEPRVHAVRARSRQLRELDAMPHPEWRVHSTAKDAWASALAVTKINEFLSSRGENPLPSKAYESLAETVELLGRGGRAIA